MHALPEILLVLTFTGCVCVASAASVLFTDATIIQLDTDTSRTEVLHNTSLLVEGDRIIQTYNGTTPGSYPEGTEVVNGTGKIISPGFIDTHHHLRHTAFKTIASNTSLVEYIQRYSEFSPAIQHMSPEDKYLGQLMGCLESLDAGTTTVSDHAHGNADNATADAVSNATVDSKLRSYHAFALHQRSNGYTLGDQLYKLAELVRNPRVANGSLIEVELAFDGFETSDRSLVDQLWQTIHNENLSIVTRHTMCGPWITGNSPTFFESIGWLNTSLPIVFSHASYIASSDMSVLRATNQYLSTTPRLRDALWPRTSLRTPCSGSGCSRHRPPLQLFFQHGPASALQAPVNNPISVDQAFYLLTRAGALALRRPDLGIIAPGAKADLVVFYGESTSMVGWANAVAAIVLHSNVCDIAHVLVGGEWVKRDGRLLFDGYDGVKRRLAQSARKTQQIWSEIDWPPVDDGLWVNATEYGYAQNIDTLRGNWAGY